MVRPSRVGLWSPNLRLAIVLVGLFHPHSAVAQTAKPAPPTKPARAPIPSFDPDETRGVFFDKFSDAFNGTPPTLSSLKPNPTDTVVEATAEGTDTDWTRLIRPVSLEDEIKRLRLEFERTVTTPSAFNSGGFRVARVQLTALATLFAVIENYAGEVRWKEDAAAASRVLARTARSARSASTTVFNEAKSRKLDLSDLVSGASISAPAADEPTDWYETADRSALMEYFEIVTASLEAGGSTQSAIASNRDAVIRDAELLAVLAEVITREGMDEADDEDYVTFSHALRDESVAIAKAADRQDDATAVRSIGRLRQRCDACHQSYR